MFCWFREWHLQSQKRTCRVMKNSRPVGSLNRKVSVFIWWELSHLCVWSWRSSADFQCISGSSYVPDEGLQTPWASSKPLAKPSLPVILLNGYSSCSWCSNIFRQKWSCGMMLACSFRTKHRCTYSICFWRVKNPEKSDIFQSGVYNMLANMTVQIVQKTWDALTKSYLLALLLDIRKFYIWFNAAIL